MYLVTAVKDIYEDNNGVEVAGIFDSEEKAQKAKKKVEDWLAEHEFEDSAVFALPCDINKIKWYSIEENI